VINVDGQKSCVVMINKYQQDLLNQIRNLYNTGLTKCKLKEQYSRIIVDVALQGYKAHKQHWSHSIESKQKLSKSMQKFFSDNPDKLPYRLYHSSKCSYVEELFKKALIENDIDGWQHRYKIGIYEYDFAFVDKKIDVEIDGKTHTLDSVKDKDKMRDEWSKNNNWMIVRFTASDVKSNLQKCIEKLKFILNCGVQSVVDGDAHNVSVESSILSPAIY
jgi:very-short-patch-repair endonuclease